MYAKIEREFQFQAGVYFQNNFVINTYDLVLQMLVMTEDLHEQNIAFERIKYILEEALESCIFVHSSEKNTIDLYSKAQLKICVLPDEPYDQIVAGVILSKLNSITEEKIIVDEIKLLSKISDGVSFFVSIEDLEFLSKSSSDWYTENNISINNLSKKVNKKEKILELKNQPNDWNSIGLHWNTIDSTVENKISFSKKD